MEKHKQQKLATQLKPTLLNGISQTEVTPDVT
jgi:hypothetical protein